MADHQSPVQEPEPSGAIIVRKVEPFVFGSTLVIKNPIGSIVLRGWDREQLHVQATASGEPDSAPILEINKTASGAEVVVKDLSKRRFFGLLPPKIVGCDLVISLPRKILADAKATNGTIAAYALDGSLKCETVNGRIQIERVLGRVETKTVSGAIAIARLAPSHDQEQGRPPMAVFEGLVANSVNGSIALEDIISDAEVSTIHGKIEARRIHVRGGETSFETISGDLEIEMLRGVSEIAVKSMAGRLDVQVPNSKITEESKTQTVIQLSARPSRPSAEPSQTQAITIKTVSGKITLR
ncbi:MAG: hypothetical protein LBC63_10205 [Holophagales bacterium]|nr:hypothetical protein [Holophagales bacterium]